MNDHGLTLFDTAIGRCGIAWGPRGITAVQIPEANDDATRARLRHKCPGAQEIAPPPEVRRVMDDVVALLQGEAIEFADVELDLEGVSDFSRRVYEITRSIPPGSTLTYGEIAKRLGAPDQAQAVGVALGKNPIPIIVPCHRVLAAGGKVGGFSANGGITTKRRLLWIESPHAKGEPGLFDNIESPKG
ncbi:MAG TPA: methylated-DNA--[protein]-cysteine S-methyltransferase [Xanthobacteraceae bacterium]|jgi:methylated-DNA-[protein]-cysteine S-methyltransferase|nr:methylated-DNA--[protein]-cysteine S-methyltransferase [Xanthobacteraceae bacterium]